VTGTTTGAGIGPADLGPVGAARFIGQSIKRKEDPRLLSGHGTYVDDVTMTGTLHAAFVRSPVARADITRLDVEAARALDGVHAVFTADDFRGKWHEMWPTLAGKDGPQPPPGCLADGDVRFVGDPIAIVIADNRYIAEDACDLVEVDFDVKTPVVDYEKAAADTENIVHKEWGTNVGMHIPAFGLGYDAPELQAIFDSAAHVTEQTIRQSRSSNVPMETRGISASWNPYDESLEVRVSTQNQSDYRAVFSRFLNVPEQKIHVIKKDVGGAFGQKGITSRDDLCVVLSTFLLGRPVKWIEDRRENLIASNHARIERAKVKMAFDEEGHILAMAIDYLDDIGAYPLGGLMSTAGMIFMMVPGAYKIPVVGFSSTTVFTNTCGRAPYRGPWQFETALREIMLDIGAREMGIDPLEIRRRNVFATAELPYTSATGTKFEAVSPAETLEQAAEILGYAQVRAEQEAARKEGRLVGVGIALYVEPTGMAALNMSTEGATLRVEPTGTVTVSVGSCSHGQGLETTIPQVVADTLGVDIDDVVLIEGDTGAAPFGGGTGGSRSAVLYSGAAHNASVKMRERIFEIAAHSMEAAPEDLEMEGGVVSVRGTPSKTMPIAQIADISYTKMPLLPPGMEPGLETVARFTPSDFRTMANSCHIALVEVDANTGLTEVLRYISSEDCGVLINPMIVEGQIAGGVIQGMGGVLFEHCVYDDDGNPLATTFMDYLLPSAPEIPIIEYGSIVTPAPTNPGGHKGAGEGGAIGSVPAIVNAIGDALSPLGVTVTSQPLGPNDIFELIHAND
jgi:carbon-monoxide dehydrogenase large subunit